jgi:hypothetical protein
MEGRGHRRCGGGVVALVGAVVAVALLSGCGGGNGSATGEGKPKQPLSRAVLIARADTVCVAGQQAYARVTEKNYPHPERTSVPDPTERLPNVRYSEELVDVAKHVTVGLEALEPPPQLREAYEAYVDAVKEVQELAEAALKASNEDVGGPYYKARKTRDAGKLERANLAEAVGLKKCSPNPFFK